MVLEHDLRRVPPGPRERRKVFYGDGSDPRVLRSVAADRAAALVITLDRPAAAERLVATARPLYPDLAIVARGHDADVSARLRALGATVVVPETLELSLIIGEAVLRQLASRTTWWRTPPNWCAATIAARPAERADPARRLPRARHAP